LRSTCRALSRAPRGRKKTGAFDCTGFLEKIEESEWFDAPHIRFVAFCPAKFNARRPGLMTPV
jgi:hypothetical protein